MSRVDPDKLREIAALSAAINRHKLGLPPANDISSYRGHAQPHSRGRGRGRGYSNGARGRGRGSTPYTYSRPAAAGSANRTLVINNNSKSTPQEAPKAPENAGEDSKNATADPDPEEEEGEIQEDKAAAPVPSAPSAPVASTSTQPFKKTSRHRTLVLNGSTNAAAAPTQAGPSESKAGREVVINGVTFISDASGKKLARKDLAQSVPSTSTSNAAAAGTSTPSKTSVGGQAYVRTKSGNLISADLVKKREMEAKRKRLDNLVGIVKNVQQARSSNQRGKQTVAVVKKIKTLCQYFQKTGQCKKGLTCPYIHDSDKVSICPRYIKKSCPYPSSACPLSHEPNANRMPQCQHFPYCTKGTDCPYNHVHVSPNAKVCKDFVTLGWCERGLECKERHVWECPEFSETGECNKRGCKYPHVIRRKTTTSTTTTPAVDAAVQDDPNKDTFVKMDQQPETQTTVVLPVASAKLQRKRSYDEATASDRSDNDDYDNDASSFIENAIINHTSGNDSTGVSGRKKKLPKIDAMEANDDFVTLVISESEEEDDEDEKEQEEDVDEVSDVDSADDEEPKATRDEDAGSEDESEVDEDGDDTLMIFDGPEVTDESAAVA